MSVTSIDTASVLHRHDKAMSVVDRVDDADARWELLKYVLLGSPAVDEAFHHERLPCSARSGVVVSLRRQGWTFKRIAEELGYAGESSAHKAFQRSGQSAA